MVYDFLENAALYAGMGTGIAKGLDALKNRNVAALEPGDYPIDGDKIVLKIQSYNTKPAEQARFEAHRRFIDIQCIVSGEEKIGIEPLHNMVKETEARPEGDIWFYEGTGSEVLMRPGQFMIIYPSEAHAPCIATGSPTAVKKALIKVAIDY